MRPCLPAFLLVVALPWRVHAEPSAAVAKDYDAPDPTRTGLDYARAAANVLLVNWVIWQIAWARNKDWAPITRDTISRNLRAGFPFDHDMLPTNFFGHPYHGSLLFNAARGAGLSFWESSLHAVGGSLMWELFAEREPPSSNDLVATGLGGVLLGEITHRLSSQLLDDSRSGAPRLFRELGATLVNPVRGFDRLGTAHAWQTGPPPVRIPVRLRLHAGGDRVQVEEQQEQVDTPEPALVFGADVEYGELRARSGRNTLRPFEFFELYAGVNVFRSDVSGVNAHAYGLLYGADVPLSGGRDNSVFGVAMNYEFVGTNFTTYSGVSAGIVNHLVLRFGGQEARFAAGLDVVPILGATSTADDTERGYNFASGMSPWTGVELRMGRRGDLGLRMRHYVAVVVEGEPGYEFVGATRLWYELPVWNGLGFGVAPTLVYRRGEYSRHEDYAAQQVSTQAYVFYQP